MKTKSILERKINSRKPFKITLDTFRRKIGQSMHERVEHQNKLWLESGYYSLREIRKLMKKYPPISEYDEVNRNREYDIGRIRYFYENPKNITPVWIEEESGYFCLSNGFHRSIARILLRSKYIDVSFKYMDEDF